MKKDQYKVVIVGFAHVHINDVAQHYFDNPRIDLAACADAVRRGRIDAPAPTAAPAASDDGSWTCENGHSGNTGNFCTECGAARPAAHSCQSCGYDFGDTTPKFCPNCGKPVA